MKITENHLRNDKKEEFQDLVDIIEVKDVDEVMKKIEDSVENWFHIK